MGQLLTSASEETYAEREKPGSLDDYAADNPDETPGKGVIYAYNSGPVRPAGEAGAGSLQQLSMLQALPNSGNWRARASNLLCCFASSVLYSNGSTTRAPSSSIKGGAWEHLTDTPLLEEVSEKKCGKITLVLDLDETMVHSSFTPVENADFVVPVEVEGSIMQVYVLKRPWLDYFLEQVSYHFEVVIFTASLAKYANAVLDYIDKSNLIDARLYRESCDMYAGGYVKDLSRLGRPLEKTLLVDNSSHSYAFQPENGLPSATYINDPEDRGLLSILNILLRIKNAEDVREVLADACIAEGYCGADMQLSS